jgi:hypothetical protein
MTKFVAQVAADAEVGVTRHTDARVATTRHARTPCELLAATFLHMTSP